MKKIIFLFLLGFLLSISFGACHRKGGKSDAVGIKFERASYKQVLDKAQKMGKPVFIDLYASWCGPCKMMERTVFVDKTVGNFHNANFINFRIDGEKGEGRDLVKQFNIMGYPTLIYVDGSGKVLHTEIGAIGSQELMRIGKNVLKGTH